MSSARGSDSSAASELLLNGLLPPPVQGAASGGGALPAGSSSQLLAAHAHQVLSVAVQAALDWHSRELDAIHLLWALTQVTPTAKLLADSGVQTEQLAQGLRAAAHARHGQASHPAGAPSLSAAAKRAMAGAYHQAREEGIPTIEARHLLVGLATDGDSPAGRALARAIEHSERDRTSQWRPGTATESTESTAGSATPKLEEFGLDITELAKAGHLDPVIGRAHEIEQAVEVLGRRTKNNPVFVGEPGVGKTAIVEGLAQRIVGEHVPGPLVGKRLISLDVAAMVAGAKYRGEFEQRFRDVLAEIRQYRDDVLVFVDEMHTLVGAGAGEGNLDAGTMLKPALARGDVHLIGASSPAEYRRYVEKDPALERRFQPIVVNETSVQDSVEILHGLRQRYQQHHQVVIADEAIVQAARLSERYLSDRCLPDKAVDLLDHACSRVRLQRGTGATNPNPGTEPVVEPGDVADVVAARTGIPVADVTAAERADLLDLEQRLGARVIGQDPAVRVVSEAIRRARAGLADPQRPIGSFLFLGPTGVGKTELARGLAHALFADPQRLVRFDMGEFQERHTVSRLVGAPPGYLGHDEAGQLTERIRKQPYSVLLLDEIEKAHPDVFNTLLQLLDAGRLTDAQGRTVNFTNTVVIMTSNIGADRILAGEQLDIGSTRATRELLAHFRPEFVNRIDEVVTFQALGAGELTEIASLLLERTYEQLLAKGIRLEISEAAVQWLVAGGYEPEFGARPLRRVIQRELDNRLAALFLDGSLVAGTRVVVDVRAGALACEVTSAWEPVSAGRHAAVEPATVRMQR